MAKIRALFFAAPQFLVMNFLGFTLRNNLFVAPMAGVTDRPFRQLAKRLGAGLAVSEMVTSNSLLYGSAKTRQRANHAGEPAPVAVQIAGADAHMMAAAARYNVENGADIIDINMGCPAKKVCNVFAGSALMKDQQAAAKILDAVVRAVPNTPVTLKMRTGWDSNHKNAPVIAKIAEDCGIRALTIHGRTRADQYQGNAEYDTIAQVKSQVGIPVIANGDIDTPQKARYVLDTTRADGLMIGRAAQGRPWLFAEIEQYLATGKILPPPDRPRLNAIVRAHLYDLYAFYGEETGVKIARKHIGWYAKGIAGAAHFRQMMNLLPSAAEQIAAADEFFSAAAANDPLAAHAA